MKKHNLLSILSVLLLLSILLIGCSSAISKVDDSQIRNRAQTMLDCLIADDLQNAYALVSESCTAADFEPVFQQMKQFLGEVESYDMQLLSYNVTQNISTTQSSKVTSAVYAVTINTAKIILYAQTHGDDYVLHTFRLAPYEQTDYYCTGTITTMDNASTLQWIVLLSNLLSLGLAVFAFIDCCRHKIKKKVLWILFLVLGFISLGFSASATGVRFNVHLGWIVGYSALLIYGSGAVSLRLMFSIGAIAYLICRKSLIAASAPELPSESVQETIDDTQATGAPTPPAYQDAEE